MTDEGPVPTAYLRLGAKALVRQAAKLTIAFV
jgi:hypothetical protein